MAHTDSFLPQDPSIATERGGARSTTGPAVIPLGDLYVGTADETRSVPMPAQTARRIAGADLAELRRRDDKGHADYLRLLRHLRAQRRLNLISSAHRGQSRARSARRAGNRVTKVSGDGDSDSSEGDPPRELDRVAVATVTPDGTACTVLERSIRYTSTPRF